MAVRAAMRLEATAYGGETKMEEAIYKAAVTFRGAINEQGLCKEVRQGGRWGSLASQDQILRQNRYLKRKLNEVDRGQERKRMRYHNCISTFWIVHAGLSDPGLSLRSVADWCKDFNVSVSPLAPSSVSAVRDAFCETLKGMANVGIRKFLEHVPCGWILIKQVHDEANMRLRSHLSDSSGLKRGRCSSIQNSVLTIHKEASPSSVFRMPLELIALNRKNARGLATALLHHMKGVLEATGDCLTGRPDGQTVRTTHVVIGDGVSTNEAACKIVFDHMQSKTTGFMYNMFVMRCASHQANLVVQTAICGPGVSHKELDGHPLLVCCSRLFRHLMPEMVEGFSRRLFSYIENTASVRSAATVTLEQKEAANRTKALQSLYGREVLPDRLVGDEGVNGNLKKLECIRAEFDEDDWPNLFETLQRYLLQVEEKPVVTRFHLFADCVYCLLRWKLFGICPETVLQSSVVNKMQRTRRRLSGVQAYLKEPQTDLDLICSALCLQLAMYATNLTGQKVVSLARGASGEDWRRGSADENEPTLVKLARGHVASWSWARMAAIMQLVDVDPVLRDHKAHVLECLIVTAGELHIRFKQYETYPTRIVLLSRRYNPDGYLHEMKHFLTCSCDDLDRGFSLPLREEAKVHGSIQAAIQYLHADTVQELINAIALHVEGSSLDVERKHRLDKTNEKQSVWSGSGKPKQHHSAVAKGLRARQKSYSEG